MHVVASKKELQRVLQRCQEVANKRSSVPSVGNALLKAEGDQLTLAATDLQLAVTGVLPAQVKTPGSIAVGARDLFDRVKMMPDGGELDLEVRDDSTLVIKALGAARRFVLHGIPADDFPVLPAPDEGQPSLKISAQVLGRLITKTHFSISADESRAYVNSALFEWSEKTVRMVTTDGHRLSMMEVQYPSDVATNDLSTPLAMLIPLKGVLELKRLCDDAQSDTTLEKQAMIAICQTGPDVFFRVAGLQFSVKLVDATFPSYEQVIPEATRPPIRVPVAAMMDALRAVRVAAVERFGGVQFTIGGGAMRFESENPDSGAGFDEIAVDYDDKEVTVGFNASYFLDILGVIDHEDVLVGIGGELDPAVLKPAGQAETESYLAVVMPMRI